MCKRRSYFGGRVNGWRLGTGAPHRYDINSAFPARRRFWPTFAVYVVAVLVFGTVFGLLVSECIPPALPPLLDEEFR
jgi:hypothetical protein